MSNQVSVIEQRDCKFLIFAEPTDSTMADCVQDLSKYNVHHVVRACEPRYTTTAFNAHGIQVHELEFPDGSVPPQDVINTFLSLCKTVFQSQGETIGVHCVAGLGRAPLLVAIALIEHGLYYEDAVNLIRNKRQGATAAVP